jgi:parvulin-like peptidyl-prolyl isomerase
LSILKRLSAAALLSGSLLAACGGSTATPSANFTPAAPPETGGEESGPPANPDQQAVATVNGVPISAEAYNRELARFEAGRAALGFEVSDEAAYRQQVLDLLIENELIRQAAVARGISVSEEQIDAEVTAVVEEFGQEYFDSWLQTNYYTLDEFREETRLGLLTDQLLPQVLDAVPTSAEQVHARHILVNSEGEAETVLTRLQNGEDFAALAAEYSVDVTTKDQGGDLGWFPRGGLLVPEVEDAAFSLQVNEVSGVIASAWGYHIVQTLEFDPNREIDQETQQRLRQEAVQRWLESLRGAADIQKLI